MTTISYKVPIYVSRKSVDKAVAVLNEVVDTKASTYGQPHDLNFMIDIDVKQDLQPDQILSLGILIGQQLSIS